MERAYFQKNRVITREYAHIKYNGNTMKPEDKEKLFKEIANEAKKLVEPVNYKILEAKGVISKEGPWYRVHDINKLPDYIKAEVVEERHDNNGTKVIFRNSPDYEKYAEQFRRLGL